MNDRSHGPAQVWQTALGELQLQLPRETFDTWLRNARLIAHEDGTFIIGVHNIYAREWLEQRLKKVIIRTLGRLAQREVEVRFVLASDHRPKKEEPKLSEAGPLLAALEKPSQPRFERLHPGETGLNERQTFDVYATGASNRLAHAAATAITELPGTQFNPLYIHGGVGVGKSHLLHAIGNACTERDYHVLYVSSETFTNDLVAAIRQKTTTDLREKYRNVDVLLMDDIQFMGGKDSTQEEFYHTFNELFNAGAQIVVAANALPADIPGCDARLRSRFEGGLVVEIQPPDFLTRVDILELKASMRNLGNRLTLDVLERIAEEVEGSARELEGALNRVLATMLLTDQAPTLAQTDRILDEVQIQTSAASKLESPRVEDIVMSAADYFGILPEDIYGRNRSRDVSIARQVAMYIAREVTDLPLQDIGEALGGRNHSTVLYSCERIDDLMQTDSHIRRQVQAITRSLAPQNDLSRRQRL